MKRQELESWLLSKGYLKDKFGHFQKTIGDNVFRFKMQTSSVRVEKRVKTVDHNEWLHLASSYYKNLSITEDNKLSGRGW